MTSPSDERVCIDCEHVSHLGGECDVPVGYDHLNGDHECGCPGTSDLLAEVDRLTAALAQAEAERNHLLNTFFATCPIEANHEHGVWCGSNWVTTVKRAEKAEADLRVLREGIEALVGEPILTYSAGYADDDRTFVETTQLRALLGEAS